MTDSAARSAPQPDHTVPPTDERGGDAGPEHRGRVGHDLRPRRGWRARLARPALATGAGALVAFSLPPWGFWPLAIVGIALFDVAIPSDATARGRARLGWWFGAGWMYLGMGWMVQLTLPGYLVASAIFAALHALAAAAAPLDRWGTVGRAASHTIVEALRFSFPFGGVPLATLGMSQAAGPLAGVVRVGGVVLLTWVVFQLGFALAALARSARPTDASSTSAATSDAPATFGRSSPFDLAPLAVAGIVIALAVSIAPRGTATGETLRIAAVQGGGEQGTRAIDVPSRIVTDRHLDATATITVDDGVDLVLWPENTIDVASFEGSEIAGLVTEQAQRLDAPISVGLTEDVEVDGRDRFTNAQVVVTPDGEVTSRYDKVRRVPFGEYVPFRSILERITSAVDQVGDAVAGTEPAFLELPDGERLATVISWEVFFGGRAREGTQLGATAVINPTNGASYTGTIVQTQQVASSRLRAIETGRWVVQVAPTGFSAFVDHDGNVRERSGQREQIVLFDDVELREGSTWYGSLGDRPFIVAVLVALLVSRWSDLRRLAFRVPRSASPDRR